MAARAALPRRMHPVAAACWHRPLRGKPSNPGVNRDPVPGGHKARPYGETGGGSVGADFISARAHRRVGCTLADRTQKSLPWCQGEVARPPPRTEGISSGGGPEALQSLSQPAPDSSLCKGSLFSQASRTCGRRTALHTEAGGPMWASAPTRETVELRCESEPGFGRPYRPHLGTKHFRPRTGAGLLFLTRIAGSPRR